MAAQITCECGYIARSTDIDVVVDVIEKHLGDDHPEMARTVSRDDIRSWAEFVPD
ncbi:MAG TPA: hypothetical protein VFR23_01155 [Jiangellaceae bacterium]|nr:hypothetical protein [Jiangellaceae bacterium]